MEESTSIGTYIESLKKANSLEFDKIVASHFLQPFDKGIVAKLINCAGNIEISKSTVYSTPMIPIEGLMYGDIGKDSVSIVYTKDKL